ncbi:helix-turn-helix domain-containing protein [Streptomyces sp. DW26H14]|uniref:helix-turn-helix domain-containing protein n=1 Tax=Streptomyces sp. DW26H14 TaxID=3435395 RepID=UPI00403D6C76
MTRPANASLAARVGARIRALRAERGMSLSELARTAGLGKATLSALENGTRNPTLETLYALATRLDAPLAALIAEEQDASRPVSTPTVHGAAVTATLLEVFRDGGTTTELYRLAIRPGIPQTSPAHPAGVIEYLTVFIGTALVGPVGAVLTVGPGEHASFPAEMPHTYTARGPEEVHASLLIRSPAEPGTW